MTTDYVNGLIQQLEDRIADLSDDKLVETNDGTYGDADPQYHTYMIFERLDGETIRKGCDPDAALGYARKIDHTPAAKRREIIAEARTMVSRLREWPNHEPLPGEALRSLGVKV